MSQNVIQNKWTDLELPYSLPKKSIHPDRALAPEELQHLTDLANIREKVVISMLAFTGFRTDTLVRLRYQHVKRDIERNTVPIHIHVEAEITKGKYHDYDTFLVQEAADYLSILGDPQERKQEDATRNGRRGITAHKRYPTETAESNHHRQTTSPYPQPLS